MSIDSWKDAFYPDSADICLSEVDALKHSIRKWKGLSRKYLVRNDMAHEDGVIFEIENPQNWLEIDASTCALCHIYLAKGFAMSHQFTGRCTGCPLVRVRGGVACDDKMEGETLSPYHMFIERSDHRSMLTWLNKALASIGEPVSDDED